MLSAPSTALGCLKKTIGAVYEFDISGAPNRQILLMLAVSQTLIMTHQKPNTWPPETHATQAHANWPACFVSHLGIANIKIDARLDIFELAIV